MILTQNQKYVSVEQDRESRDKPTYLWPPKDVQRREDSLLIIGAERTGQVQVES